jgi:hypothetical protein
LVLDESKSEVIQVGEAICWPFSLMKRRAKNNTERMYNAGYFIFTE